MIKVTVNKETSLRVGIFWEHVKGCFLQDRKNDQKIILQQIAVETIYCGQLRLNTGMFALYIVIGFFKRAERNYI